MITPRVGKQRLQARALVVGQGGDAQRTVGLSECVGSVEAVQLISAAVVELPLD